MRVCHDARSILSLSVFTFVGVFFFSGEKTYMKTVTSSVSLPICEAIAAFERRDYDEAVEHLLPVRFKMAPMGGSRAQVGR